VSEQVQKNAFAVFERMGRYPPANRISIADHGRQAVSTGQRIWLSVTQHALIQCDRDSQLAYLKSSNPKNISLSMNDMSLSYLVPFR